MIAAIIAAAGSGERFGASIPKALIQLGDRTLIEHAVSSISSVADQIIVTAPSGYEKEIQILVGDGITVVTGGATRSESVRIGLSKVSAGAEYVLIHDAARALASPDLAKRVVAALKNGDVAVIPGLAQTDTVKIVDDSGIVSSTPDRATMRRVQTPQGFTHELISQAHAQSGEATDDAALVESLGKPVRVIDGEERAIKITTPADLSIALSYLGSASEFRSGVGVDAHAFTADKNRKLSLAGLIWEDEIGLDGHSDGDVASHAICDALLSAADLGDLGSNFGVAEAKYEGATGAQMLSESLTKVKNAGFKIENVSVQIVGNRPKIAPRRAEAISALSKALSGAKVSVSATSTDGLGFTGEGKGLSAIATALLVSA